MTLEIAMRELNEGRAIVNIGQIGPELKRLLERSVKVGELIKYRGHWNTLSPNWGIGSLKTIYVRA